MVRVVSGRCLLGEDPAEKGQRTQRDFHHVGEQREEHGTGERLCRVGSEGEQDNHGSAFGDPDTAGGDAHGGE